MTTNVEVKVPESAHWVAEVHALDFDRRYAHPDDDGHGPTLSLLAVVRPGVEQVFYATDTRGIMVLERPL